MDDFTLKLCEMLYAAVAEDKKFDAMDVSFDIETLTVMDIRRVRCDLLEMKLGQKITPEVEQAVKKFFADLDVVCKVVNHPEVGKSFELGLPPELKGLSLDQFRNRRPKK